MTDKLWYYNGNCMFSDSNLLSQSQFDFQFKQFGLNHQQCAMKVNTDGILLGAWADVDKASTILDIGTGSGLIALMLAQRTQTQFSKITTIEIDPKAAQQALINCQLCPWSKRLQVINDDVLNWQNADGMTQQTFDLIVSNPPYFTDSLKCNDARKNTARHNHGLSFQQLLATTSVLSHPHSKLALILPVNEANRLKAIAANYAWYLHREMLVSSLAGKPVSRCLMLFTRTSTVNVEQQHIYIRDINQQYSKSYTELCRDFYLKM